MRMPHTVETKLNRRDTDSLLRLPGPSIVKNYFAGLKTVGARWRNANGDLV
jgi:hypothetical protein